MKFKIGIFFIAGVFTFIITFLIMFENIVKYVREISRGIQKIADGDLNTEISVRGQDEITIIAEKLNSMTVELKELMEKERESEKSKNDLITNVAHDLRTPLTSIIGYLDLLNNHKYDSEETRNRYVKVAYGKAIRLQKLIEELFGFTKLTYGKIAMTVNTIDIVKLINQMIEEFYPEFEKNDLLYEVHSNVKVAKIKGDGNLLARLFDNLINNAIKYGASGKLIKINIEADSEESVIEVINYGYVISRKDREKIFDKFYRAEQSRNENSGGTGLGLAIARNIANMHGGDIDVDSSLDGTIFRVTLKNDFELYRERFE